jgi:hypothetical protein
MFNTNNGPPGTDSKFTGVATGAKNIVYNEDEHTFNPKMLIK